MHKLSPPPKPYNWDEKIAKFRNDHPIDSYPNEGKRWRKFKTLKIYNLLKSAITSNQHELCAYCECKTSKNNHQIEHVVPRTLANEEYDSTLDLKNMLLCCLGGETETQNSTASDETQEDNKTCGLKKGDRIIRITPYTLPEECIFKVDVDYVNKKVTLIADSEKCSFYGISEDDVNETIDILNLNSSRLCNQRYDTWNNIIHKIIEIKKNVNDTSGNIDYLKLLEEKIKNNYLPYYTTAILCVQRYYNKDVCDPSNRI